jgi:hypothetical protein
MKQANTSMEEIIPLPATDLRPVEDSINCMNDNLASAMARRGVFEDGQWVPMQVKHIIVNTNIPWGTIMGWVYGYDPKEKKGVRSQLTDENLYALIVYLECTVDWLCYGIGTDNETLVKFKDLAKDQSKSA